MKGEVTISRNSNDFVVISIHDEASGTRFVDLELSLENFAMAITGLARVSGEMKVRGLGHVGMKLVIENRAAKCPDLGLGKEPYQEWLLSNCAEEGWEIDTCLGSQGSISRNGKWVTLNYSVRKYLPPTPQARTP